MTLRGFKSFASATTMNFEPGITCIVGPNGSGKSNVVDGLAWVMGEQGVKSLRGGKMEDVIFAGTSGRAPLGRAEVVLTIDNTDGALPIDYSEVTISRTMFRNGGSDYQINGQNCRLLDVQELLSDSGIGREMHVIVGQGQLDSILRATPEGRRGFVEEAAGVLKHRKRKEKAIRKLEATEGNLHRLGRPDRRDPPPVEAARAPGGGGAAGGDDPGRGPRRSVPAAGRRHRPGPVRARGRAQGRGRADHNAGPRPRPRCARPARPRPRWRTRSAHGRTGPAGRPGHLVPAVRLLRADQGHRADRRGPDPQSLNDEADEPRSGRDPDELELEAARVRETEAQIEAEVEAHSELLAEAVERRQQLEAQHAEEERRIAALIRAAADRREGLARLTGQVNALKSRAAAAESEIGRLASNRARPRHGRRRRSTTSPHWRPRSPGWTPVSRGSTTEYEAAQAVLDETG